VNNVTSFRKKLVELGLDERSIDRDIEMLADDVISNVSQSVETLHTIWRELIMGGHICTLHRKKAPILKDCNACVKFFSPVYYNKEKEALLKSMQKVISSIEISPYFASIVPEVYVNIATSLDSAQTIDDVATIPGRIVRVRNLVKATASPEFGIQSHLAKLLLEVRRVNPNFKAVINIKFDDRLKSIVYSMKLPFAMTEHNIMPSEDSIVVSVRRIIETRNGRLLVVFDEGAFGLEPMTYILGDNLNNLMQLAMGIAKEYVTR
jgi:predicted fused transcriptional regulator/phosphomethylpyrimidine kinase